MPRFPARLPLRALKALREGVQLDDGTITAPTEVSLLRITYKKAWLEISLREGRNREIRRMCEAVGHRVEKLIRVRFGPLTLSNLPIGAYRSLTMMEVRALKRGTERPAHAVRT